MNSMDGLIFKNIQWQHDIIFETSPCFLPTVLKYFRIRNKNFYIAIFGDWLNWNSGVKCLLLVTYLLIIIAIVYWAITSYVLTLKSDNNIEKLVLTILSFNMWGN